MQHNFDLMEMAPDFYTAVIREFIPKVYYAETVIISLFSVQSRNKISQFTKSFQSVIEVGRIYGGSGEFVYQSQFYKFVQKTYMLI